MQTSIAIAHILVGALNTIVHHYCSAWPVLKTKPVLCKTGSGRATYFKAGLQQDCIVFGIKMVKHKIEGGKYDWLSTKEIQRYGYFDGDDALLNVFAHTVCHEFAHLLQYRLYKRRKGSVHNREFYQLLNQCYQQGVAQMVSQYIAFEIAQQKIQLQEKITPIHTRPLKQWQPGDEIEFNNKGYWQRAVVIRVNKKTLSAAAINANPKLHYWRIPFALVKHD